MRGRSWKLCRLLACCTGCSSGRSSNAWPRSRAAAPGTDAERRARASCSPRDLLERGHRAWADTFWLRPGWAWPVALAGPARRAAAASRRSLAARRPDRGGGRRACLALEAAGLTSPLRLFTRRRATQNVVALRGRTTGYADRVRPDDAPRRGLVLNDRWRALAARLGDVRPWLAGCALVIAGAAAARLAGVDAGWLGAIQLVPTIVLIAVTAAALDIALSEVSPGAGPASAAAVALAVHEELAADPSGLPAGLVLYGAGASGPHALRAQLRRERSTAATRSCWSSARARRASPLGARGTRNCAARPSWRGTRSSWSRRAAARGPRAASGACPPSGSPASTPAGSRRAPTSPTTPPTRSTSRRPTGRSTSRSGSPTPGRGARRQRGGRGARVRGRLAARGAP